MIKVMIVEKLCWQDSNSLVIPSQGPMHTTPPISLVSKKNASCDPATEVPSRQIEEIETS